MRQLAELRSFLLPCTVTLHHHGIYQSSVGVEIFHQETTFGPDPSIGGLKLGIWPQVSLTKQVIGAYYSLVLNKYITEVMLPINI